MRFQPVTAGVAAIVSGAVMNRDRSRLSSFLQFQQRALSVSGTFFLLVHG
jgi:hypothetical protein